MHVVATAQPQGVLIALSGHLNAAAVPELDRVVDEQARTGARRVVLDLGDLAFISSAGLCAILAAARKLQDAQGTLVLCRVTGEVRNVFEMSGFASLFAIYPTAAAAWKHA